MCRLAAFPPQFPRQEALDIIDHMFGGNRDGFGYSYLKKKASKDNFFIYRYPGSFKDVKDREGVMRHMPHDGWTIAHIRQKTHGDVKVENTHPFIKGDYSIVHNGVFGSSAEIRDALSMYGIKFAGNTDSEVAATLLAREGPEWFMERFPFNGVYLALRRDGELFAINTSSMGDLEYVNLGGKLLLASELSRFRYNKSKLTSGWYQFDGKGEAKDLDAYLVMYGSKKGDSK